MTTGDVIKRMAEDASWRMARDLLYIAAPYTHPDPVLNTHHAARVATAIFEHTMWVPMLPHVTLAWHLVTPRPVEFWYALDLHHLAACKAILRLPGASTGADAELEFARTFGLEEVDFSKLPWEIRQEWHLDG